MAEQETRDGAGRREVVECDAKPFDFDASRARARDTEARGARPVVLATHWRTVFKVGAVAGLVVMLLLRIPRQLILLVAAVLGLAWWLRKQDGPGPPRGRS